MKLDYVIKFVNQFVNAMFSYHDLFVIVFMSEFVASVHERPSQESQKEQECDTGLISSRLGLTSLISKPHVLSTTLIVQSDMTA